MTHSPKTPADAQGWIVTDGSGTKYRTWARGWSEWTADRELATRYARRQDAEQVHEEDEGAWRVEQFAASPPPGEDQAAEGEALILLTELLAGPSKGRFYGIDDLLWNKLETIRMKLAHPATPEKAAERGDLRDPKEIPAAIALWFFSDLGETQRRQLFNWCGFPGVEANGETLQRALLDKILAALAQPTALSSGGVSQEKMRICDEMDAAIRSAHRASVKVVDAALTSPPPQGWRLVPVKWTMAMYSAYHDRDMHATPGKSLCISDWWPHFLDAAAPLSTAPAPSLGASGDEA